MAVISFPGSAVRHLCARLQALQPRFPLGLPLLGLLQLVQSHALQLLALHEVGELALKRAFLLTPGLGRLFERVYVCLEALEAGVEEVLSVVSIHVVFDGLAHLEPCWRVLASLVLLVVQLTAALVLLSHPLAVERALLRLQVLLLEVPIAAARFLALEEQRPAARVGEQWPVARVGRRVLAVALMLARLFYRLLL